jgi:NADPH-dependent 2,4-dienoyl-CoA reductase/sulfur reductase-like enzyme/rhodanese-related sulfurtransferase
MTQIPRQNPTFTGQPRIVVVGGVAGGMSAAARARRLSEQASIIVLERGPYPSFANCGLPYHLGGEITDRSKLIVQTPEKLAAHLNLDVRPLQEVVSIDRAAKTVTVRQLCDRETYELPYDHLILSPGASPINPPLPGLDRAGVFTLRSIPDMDRILAWVQQPGVEKAVVVGGGYIGLEVAEQLRHRGLHVTTAEAAPQIMAPLDPEMAAILHHEMIRHGIDLRLGDPLQSVEESPQAKVGDVILKSGARLPADLVVMGLGVRPETQLARDCGLELGPRGGILVDETLRTSDPHIFALGDAAEVVDANTGEKALIPLAGPANRQGRIVADQIFGRPSVYKSTQGTAILRLFELAAAVTGASAKTLQRLGRPFRAVHLHPGSHAGYFPGAQPISLKILWEPGTRRLLGAQAVGADGVDKRIDVLATALAAGMTIDQLAQLELCYAPPFGAAKDPVNLAGMAAQNIEDGLVESCAPEELESWKAQGATVLDVREPNETSQGTLPDAICIPLAQLRSRFRELDASRPVVVYCASGQRSYMACRVLIQNGFRALNLSGAWKTWNPIHKPLTASRS